MGLSSITGIVGKSFQMGLGKDIVLFNYDIDGDKTLHINRAIDVDEFTVRSSAVPVQDEDLVNLGYANELKEEAYKKSIGYVDTTIREMIESGAIGGGGSADPDHPATPGNLMLKPIDFTEVVDGYVAVFGTLKATKYIHEIVVELKQKFTRANGERFEIAIGTTEEPQLYVPWFEITALEETRVFPIHKTLDDDSELILSCRTKVESSDFTQVIYNQHTKYVTDSFRKDASGKVTHIDLASNYVGLEDVKDFETFPNMTGKRLLDFGFNFPTLIGHQYRVVESNNPALEQMQSFSGVAQDEGEWVRTTEFIADQYDHDYMFLLGRASGPDEYVHILIYDLSGEEPDMATNAYHVQNAILISEEQSPIPTEDDFEWRDPGAVEEHEYSEVSSGTDKGVSIDAGDNVTVQIRDDQDDKIIEKTIYQDKTVDITYIKIHTMDSLTGVCEANKDVFSAAVTSEDLLDLKLQMKLMPVADPFYVKETNPALALLTEMPGATPVEENGVWTKVTEMTTPVTRMKARAATEGEATTPVAKEVPYYFALTYPEDKTKGDDVYIGMYSDAECTDMQRLYVVKNLIGVEDDNPVIPTKLPIASYTQLGAVQIKPNGGLSVTTDGELSVQFASDDAIKSAVSGDEETP